VGAAFYRLQDLLFASLDDVLKLTDRARDCWAPNREYPIVMGLINIVQSILIFAIAFQTLAGSQGLKLCSISSRFAFLYLSWTTLVTLGSGCAPVTAMSRSLIMAETGTGLVLVGIVLAVFVSRRGA
jgi:hypothetical protein